MTDPRYKALAKLLVGYSTELKKGDRVLLDMIDVPDEFSIELMRAARAAGAPPILSVCQPRATPAVWRATCETPSSLGPTIQSFPNTQSLLCTPLRCSPQAHENPPTPV